MKKIPKKYNTVVFSFVMAVMMSCIMSLFVTFRNIGLSEDFLLRWLNAWAGAFVLGFILNLFVVPTVRKVVDRVVEK